MVDRDLRSEPTLNSLIKELQKAEIDSKTYQQNMNLTNLKHLIEHIDKKDSVLLIGGMRETQELRETTDNLTNIDYCFSPYADVIADAEKMPFRSNHFDHVIMFNLMEILYNPISIAKESHRVLKENGKMWVGETYGPKSQGFGLYLSYSRSVPNILSELEKRGLIYYPDKFEAYSISPQFIGNVFKKSGFNNYSEIKKGLMKGIK